MPDVKAWWMEKALVVVGGAFDYSWNHWNLLGRTSVCPAPGTEGGGGPAPDRGENLLAEHEALFERVAEVLTKQEGPLEISCQWEERQRRVFLDDFRSPEDLEPGFTDTLQELFALLPSWGNIYYNCDDRALISVYYDHIYFVDDTGTIMLQASLDYDGTEWSVGTEMYGLV